MNSDPGTWVRIRNRIRFGLATQEVLDRLARIGIVVYPYFVVEEPIVERPESEDLHEGLEVRRLGADEAHRVASVPERPRDESKVREFMRRGTCVGIVKDGELLAYSFFTREPIPGAVSEVVTTRLPADWAYLFDMYVRPKARGDGIAVYMRHRVHQILAAEGVRHGCSVSLRFNRSSRRFKSKLGALERELRVLLRLKPFPGVDVRLWRQPWLVRTQFVSVVSATGDSDQ